VKIALTVWKERVSPLFDAARLLLIAEIKGRTILSRQFQPLQPESIHSRAARLAELGVGTLICGAISRPQAILLKAHGIHVLADVTGRAEAALAAFLDDRLSVYMPSDNPCQSGKTS
jgi:predicted Fe-Mo cluster-binding NifX family protein